jgi:hypothetical protein
MLALLEAHAHTSEASYLHSVEKAFPYYKKYYESGVVSRDTLVFFANWQSQACSKLFHFTEQKDLKPQIQHFLWSMQDSIISSNFFHNIASYPDRYATVEVACGLEGLCDVYSITDDSK